MKYIIASLVVLLAPVLAFAHTKWFVHGETPAPLVTNEPTQLYLSAWALIILMIVAIGIFLHKKKWLTLNFLELHKPHVFERAASTFTMVAGTFFIIAGSHQYLFSPNLFSEAGVPNFLIVIEILAGLAFLLGIGTRMAALLLGLSWISLFIYVDWVLAIENIWVLSTAAFIAVMGNDYFSIISFSFLRKHLAPFKRYALSLLRLGTGATLMILGFSEKILVPELGLNFLSQHDWNFMAMLGFEYSNYLFTLSAGSVEFLFGLIFVLGLVTRLNALVVAIVFTIPLFILGPIELAGHLPHLAAVVMLLLFGSGGHFTPFSDKKYK